MKQRFKYLYDRLEKYQFTTFRVLCPNRSCHHCTKHSDNKIHREAAVNIAPHYYRSVRIHRLYLVPDEEDKVKFERTLVKEFCAGEVSFRAVFTHPLRPMIASS